MSAALVWLHKCLNAYGMIHFSCFYILEFENRQREENYISFSKLPFHEKNSANSKSINPSIRDDLVGRTHF